MDDLHKVITTDAAVSGKKNLADLVPISQAWGGLY
jgi:hypothetical protein